MKITQKIIEQMNNNPLYRTLGIRVVEAGEGRAVSILEPVAEVCWPFPGQPHGGILFTMMDTTMTQLLAPCLFGSGDWPNPTTTGGL